MKQMAGGVFVVWALIMNEIRLHKLIRIHQMDLQFCGIILCLMFDDAQRIDFSTNNWWPLNNVIFPRIGNVEGLRAIPK